MGCFLVIDDTELHKHAEQSLFIYVTKEHCLMHFYGTFMVQVQVYPITQHPIFCIITVQLVHITEMLFMLYG